MRNSLSYITTAGPLFLCFLSLIFYWCASRKREETREEHDAIKHDREELERARNAFKYEQKKEQDTLNEYRENLTLQKKLLDEEREHLKLEKKAQDKAFEEKTIGFPWMASMYAMYIKTVYSSIEACLRYKERPAIRGADAVKALKTRVEEVELNYFTTLGLLKYYEYLFPSLAEFKEVPDDVVLRVQRTTPYKESDPAQNFIFPEEWEKLSSTEKFQKALDAYCKRKKSNWEIGREFERYIGYKYELDGWDINYFGAKKGLEDLGRDLIARKEDIVHIVQCKYWSKEKTIHEKHIFQLYGTSVLYMVEQHLKTPPTSVFITSCQLSKVAQQVAEILNVRVYTDKKMEDYPRIKCNIGKNGERIYHLPFDQQYDTIRIEPEKGEFYCMTVAEAEQAQFRRAYRWRGGNNG